MIVKSTAINHILFLQVCIVSDPRETNPYGNAYSVDLLGNVVGGRKTIYNNQPIETLMNLTVKSIEKGDPVWFGCEVSKRFSVKPGVHHLTMYVLILSGCKYLLHIVLNLSQLFDKLYFYNFSHDYKSVFGCDVHLGLSKADRMLYGESAMTHAMVITGVSYGVSDIFF